MDFSRLYTLVAAIFLILISGMALRRTNVINDNASKSLSKLVLTFAQPALIINSLNSIEFTKDDPISTELIWRALFVLIFGLILHFILAVPAYFVVKFSKDRDERKIMEFALLYSNCGFVGLPILDSIFGSDGVFLGAFYLISFHLTLWSWGIAILARGRSDIKVSVKKLLLNFGSIPSFIGVALFILKYFLITNYNIQIPTFIGSALSYIGSLCTPVSLLIAGALIAKLKLRDIFLSPKIYFFSFIKLIVFPILTAILTRLLNLDSQFVIIFSAIVALPSASTVTMLAETYNIKPAFSSLAVGMTTILSVFTIPLTISIAEMISKI